MLRDENQDCVGLTGDPGWVFSSQSLSAGLRWAAADWVYPNLDQCGKANRSYPTVIGAPIISAPNPQRVAAIAPSKPFHF